MSETSKVIPLTPSATAREKILAAVGPVLARVGFSALTVDLVAAEARVARQAVFRHFYGLSELMAAFAESPHFWPSAEDLLTGEEDRLRAEPLEGQAAALMRRVLAHMRSRPQLLDILAFELVDPHPLAEPLEDVRMRRALEFFERLDAPAPESGDFTAAVAVLAGAAYHLALRSRTRRFFGGLDLSDDRDWTRIERIIDRMIRCGTREDESPGPEGKDRT